MQPAKPLELSYHVVEQAVNRLHWDKQLVYGALKEALAHSRPISTEEMSEIAPDVEPLPGYTYLYNRNKGLVFPVMNGHVITVLRPRRD